MRWPSLSPRDRRTLIAGAAVIVGIVLLTRGLPAWRRWDGEARAASVELRVEAQRTRRAVEELPAMADSLAARQARFVALAPLLLAADSRAAATAALTSAISAAAQSSSVQLASMQVRSDTTGNVFERIEARATMTGDGHGLGRMLVALERGPLLLSVRQLGVTQPSPSAPPDQPETLRVELVVEGLAHVRRAEGRT